jgi:transketolase
MSNAQHIPHTEISHYELANSVRALSMDAVQAANSGHPGMPMGMADVATVLFSDVLKYDPKHPHWPDRDRFILSAGHGSMLLYSLLYLTGYEDITLDEIKNFRQLHAKTAGHPEYGEAAGIETTTGPLGQGLANAVGMAMAEKALAAEFGDDLVDHYTYVIAGDGCLMEGISQEAISMAGHLKLNKLIVLFDDNGISIDGPTSLTTSEDHVKRFEACGWHVQSVNGHDPIAIQAAMYAARASDKPAMIACRTTIGYGSPNKQGTSATHGSPLGDAEIAASREQLGWNHGPFEIPQEILEQWRAMGRQHEDAYADWNKRLDASGKADVFAQRVGGELSEGWQQAVEVLKQQIAENQPSEASRKSSQNLLDAIAPHMPELLGGSADLTGSNNTRAKGADALSAEHFEARYVHYGIREHGMASAMNGIALHGGFVPFGGTFLVFTDYCRPAIRLSALMKQRVIYVMTHDSIGLGEDGPTHQPVEHLAALRAIPNLNVYRPADATETAECWAMALATKETPSILALSRQNLPSLRSAYTQENLCAYGAYVMCEHSAENPQVTLIGTGSEVMLCVEAAKQLKDKGIAARVVSMPCQELFLQQPESYQREVLGDGPRVAVEAAIGFGWERFAQGFIGMPGFGASAPAEELYKLFGITAEAVAEKAASLVA